MRPVLQRLGWRAGMGTMVWRMPEALRGELAPLLTDASASPRFRIAFVRDRGELALAAEEVASGYGAGGHLWICYPKKSGRLTTDISRDVGWEAVQALDLHGVAQIALDADWSALRFRLRAEIASFTRRMPAGE